MSFFDSEQVQENLQDIFNTYQKLSYMTSKLPSMDSDQKLQHIDHCKSLIEKQKNFYTRLTLASYDDPSAAEMKTRINSLSNAFGYSHLGECLDAMVRTLEQAAKKEVDGD
jgi:hypothetical protein|tara:strand:- start:344 stop:676 length:333 start_codon:yes stop_codon:yes gene_type:complete